MKTLSLLSLFALVAAAGTDETEKVDWLGFVAILIFYAVIIAIGVWASKKAKDDTAVELVLAGRSMSGLMGIITMVATWVCGGYLYGTTQGVVTKGSGLAWTQAPWCYSICFVFGSLLFCKRMREKNYMTMFDPFSNQYTTWMTALLYIPAVMGDIFWIAMALSTLGHCLSVLLNINTVLSIVLAAACSLFLAVIGGMYSIAYTDVVQLAVMFVCMLICIPFVAASDKTGDISTTADLWLGSVEKSDWGIWFDYAIMMSLGGIPWQVYFQRVLSSRTVRDAKIMSMWSGVGAFLNAIAPVVLGMYATTVDWSTIPQVPGGSLDGNESSALSYIIKYLTGNKLVSYLALGGIAAATLSTADGAYLASATVFTVNVYKPLFRRNAQDKEITLVARIGMFFVCLFGTILAIVSDNVYGLWCLTSDFVFCVLFPQLLLTVYLPNVMNTYGSLAGFIVGFTLRLLAGEAVLKIPATIDFGGLPFRAITMICALLTQLLISFLFKYLVKDKGICPDIFHSYDKQLPEGKKAKPTTM